MGFYPHEWVEQERNEKELGAWIKCRGCGHMVFVPDSATSQRKLYVILSFIGWLEDNPLPSKLNPYASELGDESRGIHADIADYCDYFQQIRKRQILEEIQES